MKTVLILVHSAQQPRSDALLRASLETWDSAPLEGTQTYYYTGTEPGAFLKHPRVISFPIGEGYNTMGRKNILAFAWALEHLQWDFMARVNATCYVRKAKLLEYVQTLPTEKLFRGVGAPYADGKTFLWGGAQYLISRDVVKAFVDHADKWNHGVMEDVAISKLAVELGIPLDTRGRSCSLNKQANDWLCIHYDNGKQGGFRFRQPSEFGPAEGNFFLRIKQDGNPDLELKTMRELTQE